MSLSNITPQMPATEPQPSSQRSDPPPTANPTGCRDVPDKNRDVKAGNVTSAEKISGDVKVDAIDTRKHEPEGRKRQRRLDVKG
jgi:hypothetical protein